MLSVLYIGLIIKNKSFVLYTIFLFRCFWIKVQLLSSIIDTKDHWMGYWPKLSTKDSQLH
jgi:hypothetical protein